MGDGLGVFCIYHTTQTGRNTLCNACGVKFANALRKVVGVGAGEYVAGPSEAARIVRKRQSVHSMPEHKHKKYKVGFRGGGGGDVAVVVPVHHQPSYGFQMEEPLMQKHHYKPSKPKKRRPIPSRDDEVSGGALTPGQRRSGRPLKPSKVFAEYSVYHDDESGGVILECPVCHDVLVCTGGDCNCTSASIIRICSIEHKTHKKHSQ